jgi:transposase
MWTDEQREMHAPNGLRYPSDMTDGEWALVEPMIPPARRGGRPRAANMREVMNAIRYVNRSGCQWRMLPKDFPPHTTCQRYLQEWVLFGTLDRIHAKLLEACREAEGRDASPSAAIIDTQVAKATEKGGPRMTLSAMMRAKKRRESSATR